MKISDQLFILKNKIFNNDNIILIGILSFILVAVFACITTMNMVGSIRSSILKSNDARTLLISKPDTQEEIDAIKNISHIELVESNRYLDGVPVSVSQFDEDKVDGEISLNPLLSDEDVKIVKGSNVSASGEIICPVSFYPHSFYVNITNYSSQTAFYRSYVLDGKKLIGQTIKVVNDDNQEYTFNVVGAYQNNVLEEKDICYVTKSDFENFKSNIEVCSGDDCQEYSSLMIRVDNYSNMDYVKDALSNLGYLAMEVFTFNEGMLDSMTYIPMFICIIVLIILMTIIYNFYRKKIFNNQYQYGILKSVGYTNKDINKLSRMEGILVYLISIICSFIIFAIVYYIVVNKYLSEFTYNNYTVPIPWLYILLFNIICLFYIILIIKRFTKKSLNLCIQKLFES